MRKTLWMLPVLAGVLLAVGSSGAFAIGSLGGGTGIVLVPNAGIAAQGAVDVSLSYQALEAGAVAMYEPAADYTALSLQLLTGITKKAELWTAYSSVRNDEDSHIWGIGGKLRLAEEPKEKTALAVGGSYQKWSEAFLARAGDMDDGAVAPDLKVTELFVVATKDFTPMAGEAWEWSSGAGTRMYGSFGIVYLNADPDVGEGESLTRPFIGFEFVGADESTLGLEYRWKDDDVDEKAVFSAVLRHYFSPDVIGEVGTTNASPIGTGLDDQDWFVRLGYEIPLQAIY